MQGKAENSGRERASGMGLWAAALGLALLVNAALFGLLPLLMADAAGPRSPAEEYDAVSVIRAIKPETPPKKREPPAEKPEEKPAKSEALEKRPSPQKPKSPKPRLAFAVNSRLPATPGGLTLPPLSHFSVGAPEPEDMIFGLDELDSPLVEVFKMEPIPPHRARRMGIEGFVVLALTVDEQGHVTELEVLKARPEGIFEGAALKAAASWRFSPPTRNGKPVKTYWEQEIEFGWEDEADHR